MQQRMLTFQPIFIAAIVTGWLLPALVQATANPTDELEHKFRCGGVAGETCPAGYRCVMPDRGITDDVGVCKKNLQPPILVLSNP